MLGFVDVPGHERFVHNMLAGATGIDFVLLVVAADDGVMPQTREHLAIVDLLGITRGVVALTKVDLVDEPRPRRGRIRDRAARLPTTGLAGAEIVPVSAVTGEGVDELRARAVRGRARPSMRAPRDGRFRLAVDRSFTLAGAGTVVTGTVLSGAVAVGDRVMRQPVRASRRACARSTRRTAPAERGRAGERCALNLAGERRQQGSDRARRRGARSGAARADRPHRCEPAPARRRAEAARALDAGAAASCRGRGRRAHRAARRRADRARRRGARATRARTADRGGGRRPLRRCATPSAQRTIGGGTFLDLRAPARKRRTPERLAQLDARAIADPTRALAAMLDASACSCRSRRLCARSRARPARNATRSPQALSARACSASVGTTLALSRATWIRLKAAY